MDLPYTKTETYTFEGQPYPTEELALRAAISKTLGNSGIAGAVLDKACTLAPLLARACALNLGELRQG